MRKYILALVVLFSFGSTVAQSNDPDLNKRLDEYMRLTREYKYEELMTYMHPKLFELATKEQLIEDLKQTFEGDELTIGFDSTAITGVSDDYRFENAVYKKIDYWLAMAVRFTDTASLNDEGFISIMKGAFSGAFPGSTVNFNSSRKSFDIKASNIMFAIKDSTSAPWLFLGYEKKKEALLKLIYPKQVLEHFGL